MSVALALSLYDQLAKLAVHDLRAIATHLGLRPEAKAAKAGLVARIAGAWQQPHWAQQRAQQLSRNAQAALRQFEIHPFGLRFRWLLGR